MNNIVNWVYKYKLIAIVRGIETEKCIPLSQALYDGGVRLLEVTFNQRDEDSFGETIMAIEGLVKRWEDKMVIGAGTVLTMQQLYMACQAGAEYIVTPNTNPEIIKEAKKLGIVVLAGAMTPSEIENAYEAGADFVKIFPVSSLGIDYVKAIRTPLSHIPMIAVGGVDEKNIAQYIDIGMAGAGVGNSLANKMWIEKQEFSKITALTKEYVANIRIEGE